MKNRLRFTRLARRDLENIALYIAQDNPVAAYALTDKIERTCRVLAEMPGMGQARPEVRKDLRSFPVNPYTIYYRAVEGGVEIVRVIHQARSLERVSFPLH